MQDPKDTLFAAPFDQISGFVFDRKVVDVFPDMIKRSVPGYATIIHMVGQIAERYAKPDTKIYDLGCSLGASTLAMRHRVPCAGVKIVAVDNSPDMTAQCQQIIAADSGVVPVEVKCANIQEIDIHNASICVLNFTLQFIPVADRAVLLAKIAQGLNPGGVLILSEKISFEDPHQNQLQIELHHHFKKTQGYSDLEIAQKRAALENVLIPETMANHQKRLLECGFSSAEPWFQCFNFTSIIAFK